MTDLLTMTMESLCGLSHDLQTYTYSRLAIGNWAHMYKKCKGNYNSRLHVYMSNIMTGALEGTVLLHHEEVPTRYV